MVVAGNAVLEMHQSRKKELEDARRPLSRNQQKILEILSKYGELTAKDIAEILWARNIDYKTPEYSSVHRSLTALFKKGLVLKVGGQLKWRRNGRRNDIDLGRYA